MSEVEQQLAHDYEDVRAIVEGVPAVDLPFDFKRTDRRWEDKYGITSVPLLVKSDAGKIYDDRRLKGIFVNGRYKRIVSRKYTVFPNQEAEILVHKFAEEKGLEVTKTHTSHYGDAMYWQILDTKNAPEVIQKWLDETNDNVQVGCVVRNSLGCGVSLGADLFTYRLICSNGAIAKGRDLGSIAIRHIGKEQEMYEMFADGIEDIIHRTKQLTSMYRLATRMTVNRKMADEFKRLIPRRALPRCMEIDEKTGKFQLVSQETLWDAFNDVTDSAWHYKKAGFLTTKEITNGAHHILIHAVQGDFS